MGEWVVAWYGLLSQLAQRPILIIDGWIRAIDLPAVSAVLFGLIGAVSPCQLTTNLSALVFGARQPGAGGAVCATLAYLAGKVAVYSVVGGAVVLLGLQLQAASILVVVAARRLLGPLMVLVGLGMLGVIRLTGMPGQELARRLGEAVPPGGRGGAFLLGVAFSFAFCPTLFWLFFGLTLPLALRSPGGWIFPGLFAIGTGLPLLAVAVILGLGRGAAERVAVGMSRLHRGISIAAGGIFVLAGLHDTFVYWWF